jgi:hypothetical protein
MENAYSRAGIDLEGHDLKELVLSGIRWENHGWQACFRTSDGFYVTTREKEYLGEDFGRIIHMEKSFLIIREYVGDQELSWPERIVKMDLPRDSICDWKNSVPNHADNPGIEDVMDIDIPQGFSMEESSLDDIMDFKIFLVKKSDKIYVGIYLGNYPQFPEQERPSTPGERKELITHENGHILREEEVLIKIARRSWPVFIHAWIIDDLSDEDRLIGRQILKTISGKKRTETAEEFCEDASGDWVRCPAHDR